MVSLSSSLLLFLQLISFSSSNSLPDSVADSPTQPSNGTTVYELLPKYGLPSGLLPDSVTSFSLSDSGDFVVELQKPCYLQFEYLVYYDRRITGTLMYGGIKNLKGIEVKRFFLWLDVDEIMVDLPPSDFIYFHVGWITKKLDISQFRRVRSCSDGVSMSVLGVPEGNSMSILQHLKLEPRYWLFSKYGRFPPTRIVRGFR